MIRKFSDYNISNIILEQIEFGNVIPFPIQHKLYKSGDYICSSFGIEDRTVVVSSRLICDSGVKTPKHSI
jgi:hypothetical protein